MTVAIPLTESTFADWGAQRPKTLIVVASVLAILLIGVVDAVTGPDLSVLTFYFLPVVFSTWFAGRLAGLLMSTTTAAEWIVIDLVANGGHITHGVSIWNAGIHLAFFIGGVWTVGALKESMERRDRAERRRIEHEIETAREVQDALLPRDPDVRLRGFEVAASCEPARGISGDFYDIVPLGADFVLALGDVSGKGVAAGLLGATLLGGLRSLAPVQRGHVDALVGNLNTMLQKVSPSVRFATLLAAEFDRASSRLRWVNCGHTPGLILHGDGSEPERLASTGTVIGIFPAAAWQQRETPFAPGDTLVLFSDGLSEASDASGQEFGDQRIVEVTRGMTAEPANVIHRALIDAVTRFTRGAALSDDRTVVVLRRK